MKWQGIRKAKILNTPEDVLEHSYGAEGSSEPTKPPAPVLAPPAPPSEDDVANMDEGEYTAHLVETMKKDELVALASSLGLDSDGNKSDIAERIAAHEFAEG